MALPKLIITDIDGVWTDGGMYYDNVAGNELKKFNTSDSAGVLFARLLDIPVAVISGEKTEIIRRRCEKLKIEETHFGISNKLVVAREICSRLSCELSEVAFIGDDINDIILLREVGFAATPANAADYVKREASLVTSKSGGEGAFREFVEVILKKNNALDKALDLYLQSIA